MALGFVAAVGGFFEPPPAVAAITMARITTATRPPPRPSRSRGGHPLTVSTSLRTPFEAPSTAPPMPPEALRPARRLARVSVIGRPYGVGCKYPVGGPSSSTALGSSKTDGTYGLGCPVPMRSRSSTLSSSPSNARPPRARAPEGSAGVRHRFGLAGVGGGRRRDGGGPGGSGGRGQLAKRGAGLPDRPAAGRVLLQQAHQNRCHRPGSHRRQRLVFDDRAHGLERVALVERRPALDRGVEGHAEREQVARRAERGADRPLGGDEVRGAEDHARLRQVALGRHPRDAEVGQHAAAVGADQHVSGLHVTVEHAGDVRDLERAEEGDADLRDRATGDRTVRDDDLGKAPGLQQLHDDPGPAALGHDVEDLHDATDATAPRRPGPRGGSAHTSNAAPRLACLAGAALP